MIWDFYCGNSIHVSSVLWTNSSLRYTPVCSTLLPSFRQCLVGFIMLCSNIHARCSDHLHLSVSLPFPLLFILPPKAAPPFMFMSHYHHHFRSGLHKWVRTCDIWLLGFGLFQHGFQFLSFSCKWRNFIFFMAQHYSVVCICTLHFLIHSSLSNTLAGCTVCA
jgi:hypothetical protein